MPDFSFPEWMTRQNTFADSLAKGAQVGSAIANARYRNQALAAQAVQAEREYELREKQLQAQNKTEDLNYKIKSQLMEDSVEDKNTLTEWFQQASTLPLEERISLSPPSNLRLQQSYGIINQTMDNWRSSFQQSAKGRALTALSQRASRIDPSDAYRFYLETDPDQQIAILEAGETKIAEREKALKAVAPTIAAANRLDIAGLNAASRENIARFKADTQEKLVNLRGQINLLRDKAKLEGQSDLEAERQAGRLEVLQLKHDQLMTRQEDSQEFKKELAGLEHEFRIERDASKAALKAEADSARSYGVTENSFISRNLKTVLEQLSIEKAHKNKSIEEKTKMASAILRQIYQTSGDNTQKQNLAPAATPATSPTAPAASGTPIPSAPNRVKGQTYQTPKGPAEWTGEGWILK